MAVRGVVTVLEFYPANYNSSTTPLYTFQNHFPGSKTIDGLTYTYNSFQISSIASARDETTQDINIDFVASAANVDLVEAAIQNRHAVDLAIFRWGGNIDAPTTYNILAFSSGYVMGGASDFSTVSLRVGQYGNSLNADLPWRKIPWTIVGPLSFRR